MLKDKIIAALFCIIVLIMMSGFIFNVSSKILIEKEMLNNINAYAVEIPNVSKTLNKEEAPQPNSFRDRVENFYNKVETVINRAESVSRTSSFGLVQFLEFSDFLNGRIGQEFVLGAGGQKVYHTDYGQWAVVTKKIDVEPAIKSMIRLNEELSRLNVPLFFVVAPGILPEGNNGLPPYAEKDYSNENVNDFLKGLSQAGIPYLDLRPILRAEYSQNELFFNTDSHWRVEIGWDAFRSVGKFLNANYGFAIDEKLFRKDFYDFRTYENFFFGMYAQQCGIRNGKIDDLTVVTPKFHTEMERIVDAQVRRGTFEEVILNKDYLDPREEMNNKRFPLYHTYISDEHVDKNMNVQEGKILLVQDSFAGYVEPFLALGVSEIFNCYGGRNILQYIPVANPDVVMVMCYPGQFANDWDGGGRFFDFGV